jgi:hypothetical protein
MVDFNDVILEMQRALWGVVTPELRAVSVDLNEKEKIFHINFYYHKEVAEEIIDLWECATTETSAGLGVDYFTDYKIERLDYPNEIPNNGIIIYYRQEPKMLANIQKTFESIKCDYPKEFFSASIRCIMQKAILGNITFNIRQIAIQWWEELINIHFYYDSSIEKKDHKNMYSICKNLFNELPYCYVRLLFFTLKEPINLPHHKELIYLRYEKNYGQEYLFKPVDKKD